VYVQSGLVRRGLVSRGLVSRGLVSRGLVRRSCSSLASDRSPEPRVRLPPLIAANHARFRVYPALYKLDNRRPPPLFVQVRHVASQCEDLEGRERVEEMRVVPRVAAEASSVGIVAGPEPGEDRGRVHLGVH